MLVRHALDGGGDLRRTELQAGQEAFFFVGGVEWEADREIAGELLGRLGDLIGWGIGVA